MVAVAGETAGRIDEIAKRWEGQRSERQARRHLEQDDFDELRDAGLLKLIVPSDEGGAWEGVEASVRPICEIYRRLAGADPSVALVSAMHPAVLAYWMTARDASQPAWEEQRRAVCASALAGEQWGTITSEPGSGGDISKTRSVAKPAEGDGFLPGRACTVSGDKHFGSGSGITDRMITTALPEGGSEPMFYVLDVRDRPWDGTAGLQLIAEWDGMGMAATQSHAMRLEDTPAVEAAWEGSLDTITQIAGPFIATLFTSVVLGVLDEAVALARTQVTKKADQLRPYEQVEWTRAEADHWLAVQAYEGALRAVESGGDQAALHASLHAALRAKHSVAELAEATLVRLPRVLGGGTFSQRSPFSHWHEDVRALGFLRPPWGLSSDLLFFTSLEG